MSREKGTAGNGSGGPSPSDRSHHVSAMLNARPEADTAPGRDSLAECIAACFECAQTCTACADACLDEDMVAELANCIPTDLDCADFCGRGNILTRQTGGQSPITLWR
ncbi:hypothetical protein NCCP2145_12780 [Pseudarthrobacter sp. NCCP-2145]|nr:hypothetical protein NCCP2145_12780 [Pseudarthrobacter sp. NCCP-2145]